MSDGNLNVSSSSSNVTIDVSFGEIYNVVENHILYATTATWNSQTELVAKEGWLYIYSDYRQDAQDNNIASVKVGDGTTLLSDLPFMDKLLYLHTTDEVMHITQAEREKWNKSANAIHFLGITTTPLTDGASTNPIVINNKEVTVENGDMVSYQSKEFVFSDDAGSVWQEFGDLSNVYTKTQVDTLLADKLNKNGLIAGQGISVADVNGNKQVNNTAGIYTVKSTNVTSNTGGTWTGNIDIPDLYNGLTIRYLTTRHTYLSGVGTEDNCMLNLIFSDGSESGFVDIMFDKNTFVKEEFQVDDCITLTYFDPEHSPTNDYVWLVQRPTVTQPLTTENKDLSVLLSETPSDGLKATNCGAKRSNKIKFNPSTGDLTVTSIGGKTVSSLVVSTDLTGNNVSFDNTGTDLNSTNTENAIKEVNTKTNGKTDVDVIADSYNSTQTYSVGDYVMYSGAMYKCATAIAVPEAWTIAHWTEVNIGDEVASTNGSVQALSSTKADKANTYTKTEVNSALNNKMNKNNPTGTGSLAVGSQTTASGENSIAVGTFNTQASGRNTVALGYSSKATGDYSQAVGIFAIANHRSQHAFGEANIEDDSTEPATNKGKYIEIVGNGNVGILNVDRSNARTLDWQGNEWLAGDLTYNGNKSLTSEVQRLDGRIDALPEAMILKGTLGVGGNIQDLPEPSAEYDGWTFKVITAGTYQGVEAEVGDTITCCKPVGSDVYVWEIFSYGDTDTDTWRAIKVNGVEKLGNGISSGPVDFEDTTNVKFTFDANGNKIKASLSGIDTSAQVDEKVAGLIDDEAASEGKVYSSSKVVALLGDKANVDGEYNDMVVGNAKQLKSNVGENDKVPYLFRTSGGSIDIGESEEDTLVGGTVAFNQLGFNGNVEQSFNGSYSAQHVALYRSANDSIVSGHKYLITFFAKSSANICVVKARLVNQTGNDYIDFSINTNTYKNYCGIINSLHDAVSYIRLIQLNTSTTTGDDTVYFNNFMCIDLTQMFGSTIADYIYSLEQGTAGAGVAWFRNLFPKDYYAYNTGELMSVKTSKHIMTGFNAWDEKWELGVYNTANGNPKSNNTQIRSKNTFPILPNTTYFAHIPFGSIWAFFYDENDNLINTPIPNITQSGYAYGVGNKSFITPTNAVKCKFYCTAAYGATYNNDICINLSWDGERNGEYEPYVKYEYPLDNDLELRGIPKLDANNKLYYDGDTYESDGTVKRKYEYRAYASGDESLPDTITDGTHTVTKLDTPTTETAEPFTNPQKVNDFGTEEYEDNRTVPIPVGHDTFYQSNLRAKLEMAPDSPSGDGDYIVRQSNGQNEYVPLVKELPTLPSSNGTYTLKCTVSGSSKTLSWVADT